MIYPSFDFVDRQISFGFHCDNWGNGVPEVEDICMDPRTVERIAADMNEHGVILSRVSVADYVKAIVILLHTDCYFEVAGSVGGQRADSFYFFLELCSLFQ